MEEAHYPKLFVPVLVTLTDLRIPGLGARGGLWEIWWSQPKHPHVSSKLGSSASFTFGLCHPHFPFPHTSQLPPASGDGQSTGPLSSVQQVGAHPGPGSGKLGPVSHLWELLHFLLSLRNYWSCWNREWCDHTVTLRVDEGFYRGQSGGWMTNQLEQVDQYSRRCQWQQGWRVMSLHVID